VIEEYLDIIAVTMMAITTLVLFLGVIDISAPAICQAVKTVLEHPGSELVVYGRFKVVSSGEYVYLSCGVAVPREKVLIIERTSGYLAVGSTAEGKLYIR
jgi:hypothetical protein